jgi:hypothetical protein
VTRAISLWALLGAVLLAGAFLGRRRGIGPLRLLSAWALSSLLLWICAGVLGYAGGRVTASSDPRGGIVVGTPLGALIGAPFGIALSERVLRKAWPRWISLALAAAALAAGVGVFLLLLTRVGGPNQQAGKSVYVVFPLLGATAVLGWLIGERP